MSSVLQALKKQSSPLVQQQPQVDLSSAPTLNRQPMWHWVLGVFVVVGAAAIGWWGGQWLFTRDLDSTITTSEPVRSEKAAYLLGGIKPIKQPIWPEPAVPSSVDEGVEVLSQARTQANESIVSNNQAIDLNQVSPETLQAFDAALAEQGNGRSVIPQLAELSVSFQRTIPSFTYDGHQYSSRTDARWVVLNGIRLYEGETLQGLTVLSIAPSHVVLSKDSQAFQQPALDDWTRP